MHWMRAAAIFLILAVSGGTGFADQYFFRYNHAPIGATSGNNGETEEEIGIPPRGSPNADPLVASGTPPAPVWVGQNVLYGFSATGGTPPYSWSASGGLPPGLSFDTDGTLFGTPSAAGSGISYPGITVTVTDAVLQQHTIGPFTIDVAPILSASGAWPPVCYVGDSCSSTFTASGGYGSLSWNVENASGATVSSSGTDASISWFPPSAGAFNDIRVSVQDSLGQEASVGPFSAQILAKPIASGSFPETCYVGQECNATFTASGGDGSYTWSIASAPAGMTISASGATTTVMWTPTTDGTFSGFSVVVADGNGVQHSAGPFSVQVEDAPEPMIVGEFPEYCSVGTTCSVTLSIVGDPQPYEWELDKKLTYLSNATLTPNGNEAIFSWSPTGRVNTFTYVWARPISGGTYLSKTIYVSSKRDLVISKPGDTVCVSGQPCELTFTVAGGIDPYEWDARLSSPVGTLTVVPSGDSVAVTVHLHQTLFSQANLSLTATDADGNRATTAFYFQIQ